MKAVMLIISISLSLNAATIGYTPIERREGFSQDQIDRLNQRIFERLGDQSYELKNIDMLQSTEGELSAETVKGIGARFKIDYLFLHTLVLSTLYEYTYRMFDCSSGSIVSEKRYDISDFRTQFPTVLSEIKLAAKNRFDFDIGAAAVIAVPPLPMDALIGRNTALKNIFRADRVESFGWMLGGYITAGLIALLGGGFAIYYFASRSPSATDSSYDLPVYTLLGACGGVVVLNLCVAIPSHIAYNSDRTYQLDK